MLRDLDWNLLSAFRILSYARLYSALRLYFNSRSSLWAGIFWGALSLCHQMVIAWNVSLMALCRLYLVQSDMLMTGQYARYVVWLVSSFSSSWHLSKPLKSHAAFTQCFKSAQICLGSPNLNFGCWNTAFGYLNCKQSPFQFGLSLLI